MFSLDNGPIFSDSDRSSYLGDNHCSEMIVNLKIGLKKRIKKLSKKYVKSSKCLFYQEMNSFVSGAISAMSHKPKMVENENSIVRIVIRSFGF